MPYFLQRKEYKNCLLCASSRFIFKARSLPLRSLVKLHQWTRSFYLVMHAMARLIVHMHLCECRPFTQARGEDNGNNGVLRMPQQRRYLASLAAFRKRGAAGGSRGAEPDRETRGIISQARLLRQVNAPSCTLHYTPRPKYARRDTRGCSEAKVKAKANE